MRNKFIHKNTMVIYNLSVVFFFFHILIPSPTILSCAFFLCQSHITLTALQQYAVRKHDLSYSVPLSQDCFGYLRGFAFHINFKITFSSPVKNAIGILIGIQPPWWLRQKGTGLQSRRSGSIPGLRKSPGDGNGYPLHYFLENSIDRGVWQVTHTHLHISSKQV